MPRLPEFTQVKSGRKLRFLKMWPRPLNMGTVLLSLVPVKPRRLWEQKDRVWEAEQRGAWL